MANKKRKCAYCKTYLPVEEGIIINISFFCSYDHATQQAIKNQPKVKAQRDKAFRSETFRLKQGIKTKSQLANEAQTAVNKYIRARDADKPCISCGTTNKVKFDAGHFKTRGAHPELRFNLFNIHKQCSNNCNVHLSGNIHGYIEGLTNRYGVWMVEYLNRKHEPKHYSREELERIKKLFNKRARFYEKRHKKN